MMGRFLTELDVKRLPDKNGRKQWKLLAPLIYESKTVGLITSPKNSITDFSSVPRLPFIYWLFGGEGDQEGTLHDTLYSSPHATGSIVIVKESDGSKTAVPVLVDRATADRILRGARYACSRVNMEEFEDVTIFSIVKNVWAYIGAWCFWAGVRLVGWAYWED